MPKNILITGYPGVGKTTLINKIVKQLSCSIGGFYTHEMLENGRRTGFYITDFDGNQRDDVKIFEVTTSNRDRISEEITKEIDT